jgi:peptide/nickel transport system ATP-binding protein
MLELNGVSKVYKVGTFGGKELRAVKDVSFDVKDGEVVSLIGESGSGKTTIGKMILRLLSVGSGTISIDGVDISTFRGQALKEFYRKVQGVFQDPFSSYNPIFKADRMFRILREEFYPNMEGREWDAKVEDSLKCVGLNPEHVLHKYPHQLSGGQLQRFLIARACLLEIDLLVADEIISMLDASTRIDVLNVLADFKAGGLSILFITHDLSLAYYISERAIILQRGRVVEMGSTERVFRNPLHPYTKMLMASVPRLDKRWEAVEREVGQTARPSELVAGVADEDSVGRGAGLVEAEQDHFVAIAG